LVGSFNDDIEKIYKFKKELGEGAFGKVYKIENRTDNKTYACKRLSKRKIKNLDTISSEINILKELDHPNIVKLYEVYEDKGHIYLVMDELKGGELFDQILSRAQSNNYYTEKEVARLFKQIVSGVSYCHDNGICHRDLKPENVVFIDKDESSDIKLIDFGLGHLFNQNKNTMETKVGTCFYMAPEVISGKYTNACDVWSLGILLYVMISGRAPFNGANDNEIMSKILERKLEFKWTGWQNISDDCKDLIKSILVDEKNRPTCQDILASKWVFDCAPYSKDSKISLEIDELKKYMKTDKLKKAIHSVIAFRLNNDDVNELKKNFIATDKNCNGSLSLSEFKEGFSTFMTEKNLTEEELNEFFNSVDLDGNGVVNYNEFIAAIYDKKKLLTTESIYQAFYLFDVDKSGNLSLDELKKFLIGEGSDSKDVDELFSHYDINKDGEIDFEELVKQMNKEN
jgi:calcium-dependent protein kinase